jgi:two-component system NtrC family sensor kinase
MKIRNKIMFSNGINLILILLIGTLAVQNLNSMLTKLRYVEIADDLNTSFLAMRLSEKNYFLYNDPEALSEIEDAISETQKIINSVRDNIVRATGSQKLEELESYLINYHVMVSQIKLTEAHDKEAEEKLREEGRKLMEFSQRLTHLERAGVNEIISSSKRLLFFSFFGVLLSAILISNIVSWRIVKPIKDIEELASTISAGHFSKIDDHIPSDEMGSIIKAINSMSEELKNREDEIIQSKKLASLGILVAGVAHEINNPLNNISMIAQTYTEVYDSLSEQQRVEFMKKVEAETERIRVVVKNLLDFSRRKELRRVKSDVNDLIRKTLRLVQNMINISNIETDLDLDESIPPSFVDENQILQVFVNLSVNAIQAMSPGGRLGIKTRLGRESETVEAIISDTGKGIPQELLPHIFDPFFSTKEEGGVGLGLWVSYGIIKNHNGNIKVESKIGEGTVFTVELPVFKDKEGEQ